MVFMKSKGRVREIYEEEFKEVHTPIIIGGAGLSLGATAISALPASAAQAGVLSGMGVVGGFFPIIGTIGGVSLTLKQLKKLRRIKK